MPNNKLWRKYDCNNHLLTYKQHVFLCA